MTMKTEEIAILSDDLDRAKECGSTDDEELRQIVGSSEKDQAYWQAEYIRRVNLRKASGKPSMEELMDDNSDEQPVEFLPREEEPIPNGY